MGCISLSKKLTFISSALQGQNLVTLKSMAKTDNRQFRQLARQELKLYNQQLRRTGKSDFLTIRGKSNNEVIELLKRSRAESNKKSFYKSKQGRTKRNRRTSKPYYYSKQGGTPIQSDWLDDVLDDIDDMFNDDGYDTGFLRSTGKDDIMNDLKNRYPKFYEDFMKAKEKYKNFEEYSETVIEELLSNTDDIIIISEKLRETLGKEIGQILQKTNGEKTDFWKNFKK